MPCIVCGSHNVQAAHIRSGTGGGAGYKPPDKWCVPLCVDCHADQHRIGEKKFWGDNLSKAKNLAEKLYQLWSEGEGNATAYELIARWR